MAWTCEQTEERLSDYLDRLMSEPERALFTQHAENCAHCAPLLARVTAMVSAVRSLEELEPPLELTRRILDGTVGPRPEKKTRLGWLPLLWQPRFALGVMAVLATFTIVFQAISIRANRGAGNVSRFSAAGLYRSVDRRAHLAYARGAKFVNDLRVVYEIQSRLQGGPASAPAPEQQSKPDRRSRGQVNHALPSNSFASLAALVPICAPQRTTR